MPNKIIDMMRNLKGRTLKMPKASNLTPQEKLDAIKKLYLEHLFSNYRHPGPELLDKIMCIVDGIEYKDAQSL